MAGSAIRKSRPRLPDVLASAKPLSIALPELLEPPEPGPDEVGIKELDARFASSGGMDSDVSMIGRTLRLSRPDSFCMPKRTPEYLPDSLRFGAMRV